MEEVFRFPFREAEARRGDRERANSFVRQGKLKPRLDAQEAGIVRTWGPACWTPTRRWIGRRQDTAVEILSLRSG